MESSTSMDASDNLSNGILVQHCNNVEVSENLGVEILKDFDSYLEDIEDRLTVSRMVSDSVIKGMICAVEQEAVEKIAQKDSELDRLKETLRLYRVSSDDNESLRHSVKLHKPKSSICEFYSTNSSGIVDHDKLPDSLADLKFAAKEQFKKLKTEIDKIKVSTSIRGKVPGYESLGLSHILLENMCDKWIDVDRALDGLRTTLESICRQSEKMVCVSKSFLFDWQQEREFQAEIEGMVIKNCIQSLQEEFEQKLWDQNSQSSANESADWLEKIKEISSLRQELDTISKSLSVPESGQLLSYRSLEHQKASGDCVSSPPWEGNGKHDESVIVVPENLEHAQLKHLSKEELFNYLKAEMTKMKRHHELQLREKTEKYYILKRDYLNAKGSSLPVKKDKELDSFRKKIPEVILKLDNILTEIQKLPSFSNNGDSLDNLKDRLRSLRLENQQLRDLLMDKKKEIKHLYSKVSNASEKHSFAEENLSRMLKNLKWTMEDAKVEASISQDLYKFLLKEVLRQMEGLNEELNMEYDIILAIYKNILKEATDNAAPFNKLEIEDSVIESTVIQEICEIIFRESFKEAEEKVGTWSQKYIDENKVRMSLEMEALEKDNSLRCNIAERKKLEEEMISLRAMVDDKDKSVQEAADALAKEKEKLELASQELDNLRVHSIQQDIIISIYDEELQIVRSDLAEALEKVEVDKGKISQLSEQLEIVKQNLRGVVKEKNMLHSICQEHENTLSLVEAREKEHMKQMNSTIILVEGLSKVLTNFECKATEDIKMNSLRLGNLSSQFISLIQKANRMRRTELLYKQRLERRCSDLQKAEAEVDLLGDEVDALLSLLEKIYIALDHYSPILQHYPGVVEILKLVRRELSGESVKSV